MIAAWAVEADAGDWLQELHSRPHLRVLPLRHQLIEEILGE